MTRLAAAAGGRQCRGSGLREASSASPNRTARAPLRASSVVLAVALVGLCNKVFWRSASAPSASSPTFAALRGAGPRSPSAIARKAEEASAALATTGAGKRLLVLGGNGYVGREVVKLAVDKGYKVTSLSRRGEAPDSSDERYAKVNWVRGDATSYDTVKRLVDEADAVVHAVGLLFDVNSGLTGLNDFTSFSKSKPGDASTYDNITRKTMFNVIEAVRSKLRLPFSSDQTPVLFVSAAEAGWPDVALGPQVEEAAPQWLKEYLVAKRAVEAEIAKSPDTIRPVIFRPSLIWSWTKFDVLPVIPVFNLANALGVPFVDKTVTVFDLGKAIVAGLEDPAVSGVQRYMQIEELASTIE